MVAVVGAYLRAHGFDVAIIAHDLIVSVMDDRGPCGCSKQKCRKSVKELRSHLGAPKDKDDPHDQNAEEEEKPDDENM